MNLGIRRADLAGLGYCAQFEITSARFHVPCRTWGTRTRIDAEERSGFFEFDLGLFAEFLDLFTDGVLELVDALACDGGDFKEGQLAAFGHGGELFELVGVGCVHFGGDDDHRLVFEVCAEAGELVGDGFEVGYGIGAAAGIGDVDEVDEEVGALDVAEEAVAESGALVRAFNEPGNVCDDEGLLVGGFAYGDDAEIGLERGERVVGNFGFCCGDARDEGGLADVGVADDADIGKNFEFEAEGELLAGVAHFMLAGSLVGGRGKVLVAASAASAVCDDDALVGVLEVVDDVTGFFVDDEGADGNLEDDVVSVAAGAVGPHAVLAALGAMERIEAEVHEGVVALGGFHDDVATAAAVTTGGAATGDEFFAAEGHAAITTVTSFDSNFGFVDKHSLL